MDRARVAVFDGNEKRRKEMVNAFKDKEHVFHQKVVAEVITKQEGLDFLAAIARRSTGVDVIVLGENLSPADKKHHAAREIIKKMRNLGLPIAVIGVSEQSFHPDPKNEVVVQHELHPTNISSLPAIVDMLQPYQDHQTRR